MFLIMKTKPVVDLNDLFFFGKTEIQETEISTRHDTD